MKNRTVLVVDDDISEIEIIRKALEKDKIVVLTASKGELAVQICIDEKPDLILLDKNMPGLDGIGTLKKIRQLDFYTAVIFVSSDDESKSVVQALKEGADDYLKKPLAMKELVMRVKVRFGVKDLIDELKVKNDELRELAERDYLTNLYNMRSMYQRIEYELLRGKRFNKHIACVMMDLDNFKLVNDGHDHLFGSFVIEEVGKLISQNIRELDLPARFGGDEFLVVLVETDGEGALKFAKRMRKLIEKHEFKKGADSMKLTVSCGFVLSNPKIDISPEDLVQLADHALIKAKNSTKNTVVEQKLESGQKELLESLRNKFDKSKGM